MYRSKCISKMGWIPIALSAVLLFSVAAAAVPAYVRTSTGRVYSGSLTGIAPTVRLREPASFVGPANQYDIPLSSMLQITIDFPRVVIETRTHVFIGPFSAFTGIGELLKLDTGEATLSLPTASIHAIALNGSGFRPIPREWLGRSFLIIERAQPLPAPGTPGQTPALDEVALTDDTGEVDDGDRIVWNAITPEMPVEETSTGGIPWWIGLIGVAAIVAILLVSASGGGA